MGQGTRRRVIGGRQVEVPTEDNPNTGQLAGESLYERNQRVTGMKQPDAQKVKAFEDGLKQNRIAAGARSAGQDPDAAVAASGVGSLTPNLDRGPDTPSLDRLAQANTSAGNGFKSSGEEYMFKAKNAIRGLQGLPPIAQAVNPRDQFQADIEKSIGFGDKSALNTPEGSARALVRGINAGYSTDEVNGMLQGVSERLKPKDGVSILADSRPASPLLAAFNNPSNTNNLAASIKSGGSNVNKGVGVLLRGQELKGPTVSSPLLAAFNSPKNTNDLASSMGGSSNPFGVTKGRDATPNSPTIDASFIPAESDDEKKKSKTLRYANLVNEKGYTPKQAAAMVGLTDGKVPEGFEGTGLGALIKSLNSY